MGDSDETANHKNKFRSKAKEMIFTLLQQPARRSTSWNTQYQLMLVTGVAQPSACVGSGWASETCCKRNEATACVPYLRHPASINV